MNGLKQTPSPVRRRGFCCRICCATYLEVLVRAETHAIADVESVATARSYGWKINDDGDRYVCPGCREV